MKALELAIAAGRKRQSSRTGFIHYFPGDASLSDTIPIYENFCFALALFRQKTTESVLEGKSLVEKLLAFQLDNGNFPTYLHEFPIGWDFHLGLKIAPVLIHILDKFHTVLPSDYKDKLQTSLKKAIQKPQNSSWEHRYLACLKKPCDPPQGNSAQDWFEKIISDQLSNQNSSYSIPYHPKLQTFLGPHLTQEQGEMQPTAIEYILAEPSGFNSRLRKDHIHQLHSALLFPFTSNQEEHPLPLWQSSPPRILWKGEKIHSLYLPQGIWEKNRCIIELPENVEIGRDDLFEVSSFCNISSETSLSINKQKGTVFSFEDLVSIQTPDAKIDLRFSLLKGNGSFCGHITRANRPGQIGCKGANLYEAYDWHIGLRTLRRQGPCTIQLSIII